MIAGAGFALMAWELAQHRTRRIIFVGTGPNERKWIDLWPSGPSAEYYRIIDQVEPWFALRSIYHTVYL